MRFEAFGSAGHGTGLKPVSLERMRERYLMAPERDEYRTFLQVIGRRFGAELVQDAREPRGYAPRTR